MALKENTFVREKNRTPADVFNRFVQPELKTLAEDIGQKVVRRAVKRHTFKNRTGALEDSMRWKTIERRNLFDIMISAGGKGRIQFPFRIDKIASREPQAGRSKRRKGLTSSGKERRTRRAGGRRKGEVVPVDYAIWVEKKGFDVLIGAVTYYRGRIPRMMRNFMRGATARI